MIELDVEGHKTEIKEACELILEELDAYGMHCYCNEKNPDDMPCSRCSVDYYIKDILHNLRHIHPCQSCDVEFENQLYKAEIDRLKKENEELKMALRFISDIAPMSVKKRYPNDSVLQNENRQFALGYNQCLDTVKRMARQKGEKE